MPTTRVNGQGSVREDVADLVALIERLELVPAWVVGNSFGAEVIPHAEVVTFAHAGHIPHATQPDAYVDAILAFTARHTR